MATKSTISSTISSIINIIENTSVDRLQLIVDKFRDFKEDCSTNEQELIVKRIINACCIQICFLEQEDLKNECELNGLENQSSEC